MESSYFSLFVLFPTEVTLPCTVNDLSCDASVFMNKKLGFMTITIVALVSCIGRDSSH